MQLLKVGEVAARLRIGRSKVYELVARGELESLKIDGSRRFTPRAVDEYVTRQEEAAKVPA